MSDPKVFQLGSSLTPDQSRIMLAILVNLYGDNGVVTITKEQFESLPPISELDLHADVDTGIITVKLTEVSADE
jgi:hypothetical protein